MIYLVSNQYSLYDSTLFENMSLEEGIEKISGYSELGVDTETEGLDVYTKKLLLLQVGNFDFQVLFDIRSFEGKIPDKLVDHFNNSKILYILQNAKYDLKYLFRQGILIKSVYDTMLVETILTNGLQYSGRDLETLAEKYCNVALDKTVREEIITRGLSDRVLLYGADDVKYLPIIKSKQLTLAKDLDLINAINLDNSFVIVLAYVEYCGIKLDFEKWHARTIKSMQDVIKLKAELEKQLWEDDKYECFSGMADLFSGAQDCIINWSSPKQTINLFKSYGINITLRFKGVEKESVDAKVLEPQKKQFTILPPYLKYKEKQTEISTFGDSWKAKINPITGRIHTTFKQLMDTGRLSCGDKRDGTPNLQNVPSDNEARACFVPEEGNIMIDADYSSQEQIVLANFSKEEKLINFYAKGFKDMHSYVAFLMYPSIRRGTIEDITPESLKYISEEFNDKRSLAKSAGFAINYGGNGNTIAVNCSISKKDGEFVYKSYFEAFPKLKDYFDLVFRRAAHFGFINFNFVTKRKYFFDRAENNYFKLKEQVEDPYFWSSVENPRELQSKFNKSKSDIQRLAQNYPIQGTAADITKYACILFFKEILAHKWWLIVKIVNIIHDEILVECPIHMEDEVKKILIDCMEQAGKPFCTIVPLKATAKAGNHWVH